jgi:hypothetical protein
MHRIASENGSNRSYFSDPNVVSNPLLVKLRTLFATPPNLRLRGVFVFKCCWCCNSRNIMKFSYVDRPSEVVW